MKRTATAKILMQAAFAVMFASQALCQTNASAYFLEGSFDRYRLNPAFSPERAFLALPVLGGTEMNAGMNAGLADFIFESKTNPGKLTTFMSSEISADRFLNGLPDMFSTDFRFGTDVLAFGFGKEKWYAWFDSRIVAGARFAIPKEMFSFMKAGFSRGEYEISGVGATLNSYLETSVGFQYEPVDNLRVGASLKPLWGLAYADASIDRLYANTAGSSWMIMADASVRNGIPMMEVVLEDGKISDVRRSDSKFQMNPLSGFAFDFGAEYNFDRLVPGLTVSASISDIGSIRWDGIQILGTDADESAEFRGFLPDGSADEFADDLKDLLVLHETGKSRVTQKLDATFRAGVEYTLPFLDCLSVGELFTRYGGDINMSESLTSLNLSLFKFLELSGNVAFSDKGCCFGGMVNLHPAGINFFLATDFRRIELNPQMIPLDGFDADFRMGVRLALSSLRF